MAALLGMLTPSASFRDEFDVSESQFDEVKSLAASYSLDDAREAGCKASAPEKNALSLIL